MCQPLLCPHTRYTLAHKITKEKSNAHLIHCCHKEQLFCFILHSCIFLNPRPSFTNSCTLLAYEYSSVDHLCGGKCYCNIPSVVFDLFSSNDVMTPSKDTGLISTHEKDLKLSCFVDSLYCVWLLRQGAHVPTGYTLMIDYAVPQSQG